MKCNGNSLKELDVSGNSDLDTLWCGENQLTSLDVSHNTKLKQLWCSNNKLESLKLGNNIKFTDLSCHNNNLTKLDVSGNTNLTKLRCDSNQLTSLNLNTNTRLTSLNCAGNNLTSLNLGDNTNPTSMNLRRQQYDITVDKNTRKFEYSRFPGGFDKDKVISLVGATRGDNALTVNSDDPSVVTYKYKVRDNEYMEVTLNVTYIEFDPEHVEKMVVTTQPKLSYTEGDKLDLSGLVVTLTDNQGATRNVPFTDADFSGRYKITATPENGTGLTASDHNGKTVKLTKDGVRDAAVTSNLIVYHQSSGGDSGSGTGTGHGAGSGTSGSSAGHGHGSAGSSTAAGSTGGSSAAGAGVGAGSGHGSGSGVGVGVNDDAPTILGRGELNIQIDSAESDSKPGNAGAGSGNGNAGSAPNAQGGARAGAGITGAGNAGVDNNAVNNVVENALEVRRADAAVKRALDRLGDALAQAKRVAADPNATKAQVDAAVLRLVEARKALAAAKANAVKVRAAVGNRVVRGMRSRGGVGVATGAGVATVGLMAIMLAAVGGVFATRRVRAMHVNRD